MSGLVDGVYTVIRVQESVEIYFSLVEYKHIQVIFWRKNNVLESAEGSDEGLGYMSLPKINQLWLQTLRAANYEHQFLRTAWPHDTGKLTLFRNIFIDRGVDRWMDRLLAELVQRVDKWMACLQAVCVILVAKWSTHIQPMCVSLAFGAAYGSQNAVVVAASRRKCSPLPLFCTIFTPIICSNLVF